MTEVVDAVEDFLSVVVFHFQLMLGNVEFIALCHIECGWL